MHPQGDGEVRLASNDPLAHPLIDPRFFNGAREMRELVEGVKCVRDIVLQKPFDKVRGVEISPGAHLISDLQIEAAIRQLATTGHHPVGTCRMGPDSDPDAVVDGQLRVRGIDRLRVCDASIFPSQITGNPNAVIMAIAEKAADMVLGRAEVTA
jgi:choline dehydrogenase-like flavoprotein